MFKRPRRIELRPAPQRTAGFMGESLCFYIPAPYQFRQHENKRSYTWKQYGSGQASASLMLQLYP